MTFVASPTVKVGSKLARLSTTNWMEQDQLLGNELLDEDKEREKVIQEADESSSLFGESQGSFEDEREAINKHKETVIKQEQLAMSYVTQLLGTCARPIELADIEDNAKIVQSSLLDKRAEKRKK